MRFINVRELKSKTSEILRAAAGEKIVVTNRGKPIAVIRGVDDSEFGIREAPAPYDSLAKDAILRTDVETQKAWNPLKAVFWDYPDLTAETALSRKIREAREASLQDAFRWYMARFLERGRIEDTLRFFRRDEIRRTMPSLRISPRAVAKWTQILDFYGNS